MSDIKQQDYRICENTFGSGDFTTTEFTIHKQGVSLCSEVVDNRHEALPNGRTIWVNTSATGRLTIEEAEAFVEMVQVAIAEAKRRAAI